MAWFLSISVSYFPSALALSLGVGLERYWRRRVRWLRLTLVCACCVVVLGAGWLSQSIADATFFSGNAAAGLLYQLVFTPLLYLSGSVVGLIEFGLQCGPILAVLLLYTRAQNTVIKAATTGMLVLFFQDAWSAAGTVVIQMYYYYHGIARSDPALFRPDMALSMYSGMAADSLKSSVIYDVIGGPFAGVLCRWLTLEVNEIYTLPDRRRALGRLVARSVIAIAGTAGTFAVAYFIFVAPLRQNTVLRVTKEHYAGVNYGSKFLPIPYFRTFPVNDMEISESSNRLVTFASPQRVLGSVVATRDCETAKDAARAAQAFPDDRALGPFDLRGKTIGIDQGLGSISVLSDSADKEIANLSLNRDAFVSFSERSDTQRRTLSVAGANTLSIPTASGTSIVISTLNAKGAAHAIIEGQKPTVVLAFKGSDVEAEGKCHALSFSENPQSERYGTGSAGLVSDGIVVRIIDAPPSSSAHLTVSGMIQTSKNIELLNGTSGIKSPSTIVSYLVLDADEGVLSVGADERQIGPNQRVVLGGQITLTEDDSGTIEATGDLPYVVFNGTLLTKAVFWHLSPEIQFGVLSGLAALLWTPLRRAWPQIARRLRLGR